MSAGGDVLQLLKQIPHTSSYLAVMCWPTRVVNVFFLFNELISQEDVSASFYLFPCQLRRHRFNKSDLKSTRHPLVSVRLESLDLLPLSIAHGALLFERFPVPR